MATAMPSAVTGMESSCKVAMTGEITLQRGWQVLPIGGLKKKILAARWPLQEGSCAPEKNRRISGELSKGDQKGLEIVFV